MKGRAEAGTKEACTPHTPMQSSTDLLSKMHTRKVQGPALKFTHWAQETEQDKRTSSLGLLMLLGILVRMG